MTGGGSENETEQATSEAALSDTLSVIHRGGGKENILQTDHTGIKQNNTIIHQQGGAGRSAAHILLRELLTLRILSVISAFPLAGLMIAGGGRGGRKCPPV